MVKIAPFGAWQSPISAADAAVADGGPGSVDLHEDQVWWCESRPDEGGRLALMRLGADGPEEVLPAEFNVRNRVHEYGGKAFAVLPDGRVVFTNWADQRLYLAEPGGTPTPISPVPEREHGLRYGDLVAVDGGVWCVRETVTGDRPSDIRRHLVSVTVAGEVRELAASHHFLTAPKISPDGRRAAWLGWEHPDMPWDSTELCVAEIGADGTFGPHRVIAGGPGVSICQVEWDGDGSVLALADPTGWWNLHRVSLDGHLVNLAPCEREIGGPMWKLGFRWFAPLGDGRHAVLAGGSLAILDERSGTVTDVDVDLPAWSSDLHAHDGVVVATASGPDRKGAVVRLDLATGELTELTTQPPLPDPAYLPRPVERTFKGPQGREIPAYVFPPTNPDYTGPDGERPPFVVHVHGGPTGHSGATLSLDFAYLTSRGIGVVSVNYGGSSGYGRAFREALREQWGVVDVQDCAAVAQALADEGTADGDRLAIRGGSAGGWTSAASMTSVRTYKCGTVMYPVLDLASFDDDTHDFESRYLDGLIGALPEHADRYRERSPINQVDTLAGPVLLLQGLEDQVCPPIQADRFVASLDGSGIPHAYLTFEGEQHGFRRAETIQTALEAELSFYGQVFGFEPPGVPVLDLRR